MNTRAVYLFDRESKCAGTLEVTVERDGGLPTIIIHKGRVYVKGLVTNYWESSSVFVADRGEELTLEEMLARE